MEPAKIIALRDAPTTLGQRRVGLRNYYLALMPPKADWRTADVLEFKPSGTERNEP